MALQQHPPRSGHKFGYKDILGPGLTPHADPKIIGGNWDPVGEHCMKKVWHMERGGMAARPCLHAVIACVTVVTISAASAQSVSAVGNALLLPSRKAKALASA